MLTDDHKIRKQSTGNDLPGPRELQLGIFLPRSADYDDHFNFNVMQMGQWIAHDITLMFGDTSGKNIMVVLSFPIKNLSRIWY